MSQLKPKGYIGGYGRTDFQVVSAEHLFESITNKLYKLPDDCVLYPGHNYHGCFYSTIGEEMKFNKRIPANQRLEAFVAIMNSLNLSDPKKIDVSVKVNLKGGWIDDVNNA